MRLNPNNLTENETTVDTELEVLIQNYGINKAQADDLKKVTDAQNKQIKSLMLDKNISKFNSADYTVKLSESQNKSFNEDLLLEILKDSYVKDKVVKTKEYIDHSELELLLYNNEIDSELLSKIDSCVITKPIVKLLISRRKA